MKTNKYRNRKTELDGFTFDSKKEANRYATLKLLEKAGEIKNLRLQVPFALNVEGHKICRYIADFTYTDVKKGKEVIEDVKGMKTDVYRLKKKLMLACHNIEIQEV
jgi:hypothetical protein